ncbi:MAG: radical SAM protein [candidate division WOR-3 bacterium]
MRKPKILLIAPYSNIPKRNESLIPIGLLSIGGILRQNEYEVKVYNASFYVKDRFEHTRRYLINFAPDIIGLGFPTDALESAISIAKLGKEINKNIVIIVGGIHPTAMPESTIKVPYFDFLVSGEGEVTMLELVNAITTASDFRDIKGISYKTKEITITTERRPEISHLDILPFDNRDLLIDFDKYPKQALGQIHTSRGCPYNCAYCSSSIIWKGKVRFRSTENVLDEMEYLYQKYQVRDFNFADDNFILEPARVSAICDGIIKKGLKVKWRCCARADVHKYFDWDILKLMYIAGCRNICVGFESGSQKLLDELQRGVRIEEVPIILEMMKNVGIKINADFIIGLPNETEATLNQTLELMKQVWKYTHALISVAIFKPYPGTVANKKREYLEDKELYKKFKKIFNYAEYCNIKSLSRNPQYILGRFVASITNPSEFATLIRKTFRAWTTKNV